MCAHWLRVVLCLGDEEKRGLGDEEERELGDEGNRALVSWKAESDLHHCLRPAESLDATVRVAL